MVRRRSDAQIAMVDAFRLMSAPLQGFTEVPFRHYHNALYGDVQPDVTYYSPFLRIESGSMRARDVRDIQSPLNTSYHLVPQIIFRDGVEFCMLADALRGMGFSEIDLNMGCPHVPQIRKGRGTGLFSHPEILGEISDEMKNHPDIAFSLKMRLGLNQADEWRALVDTINSMPLNHVTLHPRTAVQHYSGEINMTEVADFISAIEHPVVFNGGILSPDDIEVIRHRFPRLSGVMVGRGLLMRPSIFAEWSSGVEWTESRRRETVVELHNLIFEYYCENLTGGHSQILSKIKPLWEYFGVNFNRRDVKRIQKAGTVASYRNAVASLV